MLRTGHPKRDASSAGAGVRVAVAVVGRLLPDSPKGHSELFWGLVALTVVYGLGCVTRLIPWERVSITGHAVAVALLQPLVVVALWLTGGAESYMAPVLVLPMLYVAYFFPARYAWPLAVIEIATYATPIGVGSARKCELRLSPASRTMTTRPAWYVVTSSEAPAAWSSARNEPDRPPPRRAGRT